MSEHDFVFTALRVVREATGEATPDPAKPKTREPFYAKGMGHKGGLKGGKARAEKLTPEQRKEIIRKAAEKRWALAQAGADQCKPLYVPEMPAIVGS